MRIASLSIMFLILSLIRPAEAQQDPAPEQNAKAPQDKTVEPAPPKKKAKAGFQAVPEKTGKEKKKVPPEPKAADAVRKRAVVVQREKDLAAQNNAQMMQWRQQLQPVLVNELNFVRQVCEIPPEQRAAVRAAGEKSLDAAAASFTREQQNGRAGEQVPISQRMQADLGKALQEALSPDQFQRYQRELQARTRHRKRATILSVVAKLEEALSLDADQRQTITESLETKWRDPWENWLIVTRYGDQYFPQIPNDVLVPHLQDTQRALWNELQKIQLGSFAGVMNQPADDPEWWGKVEAPPVGPPEPAPDAKAANDTADFGEVFLQVFGEMLKAGAKK